MSIVFGSSRPVGSCLSYEMENGDGPGPELDNISKGFKDDIVVKPFHDPL